MLCVICCDSILFVAIVAISLLKLQLNYKGYFSLFKLFVAQITKIEFGKLAILE